MITGDMYKCHLSQQSFQGHASIHWSFKDTTTGVSVYCLNFGSSEFYLTNLFGYSKKKKKNLFTYVVQFLYDKAFHSLLCFTDNTLPLKKKETRILCYRRCKANDNIMKLNFP